MSSQSPKPKTPLSLRQELFAHPSASVLALAVVNAAVCSSGAATPETTPSPQNPAPSVVPDRSDWMSNILVEADADPYKPELANTPKRPVPLVDTPQTVNVVPRQVITDQNDTNLRDILRNVPGITVQAGEGGATPGDNFVIRGFSARTDLYVDGVRDINGFYRDPFDIEQIEVTKGPASVYTGRGSTGGSINVITKVPNLVPHYEVDAGIGTSDYNRETLDVNLPFRLGLWGSEGSGNAAPASPDDGKDGKGGTNSAGAPPNRFDAAFRLNALWHTSDYPGRDEASNQRWGVAPSLAFGLGTPTQITLSYEHLDQNNMPDFGVPWVTATNIPLAGDRNLPAPVSFHNYYGLDARDFEFLRNDELIAIFSQDFGTFANLRDTVHAGRDYRNSVISAPRFISDTSTDINREFQSRDETDDVLTEELDLTLRFKTWGLEHIVLAGFEYTRQTFQNYLRATPATPLANLFDPDPDALFVGHAYRTGGIQEGATDTLAGYLFDTVKIGPHWQVSGGFRYDHFEGNYDTVPATGATAPGTSFSRVDEPVSWRGAVVYKPVEIGSIYFGAGSSFNPSDEDITLTAVTANIGPERTRAYELGTKWEFLDRQFLVDAAGFYTLKDNARTAGATPADPTTVLQGEQQALGFELDFQGRLTRDWEVIGGWCYTDTQFKKSNTPAEVGNELPGVPRHTFNIWTVYHFPLGLEAGFGAQYIGQRFANTINTRSADDYFTLDAMAAWHVNKHLTVRLNVYNFTDEEYIGALHIQGSYGHFVPGPRISAVLSASVAF